MTLELVPWRGSRVPVLTGEVVRYTTTDYINWLTSNQRFYSGAQPPVTTTYGSRPAEPISYSFQGFVEGMLYADGPVAAAEAYRLRVFGQAPLLYQEMDEGRPADFFDDPALDQLRAPWAGATLSDLMKRALIYGDFAGNAFVLDLDDELVLVRPDWIEIVLAKREHRGGQVGWRQVGIVYYEGGLRTSDGVPFLPGEYAHFVPGLPDPMATYRGMSWLTPLIREVQADIAAHDHKLAFFENAASPNLAVSLPKEITPTQFNEFVDLMDAKHKGALNAGKTLYTGGGADVTPIGSNMVEMDFAKIIGKSETRVANASGVPAVLLSFSEGMQGSSLNAGNYTAAKRNFVDTTMRDLWQNWAGSIQQMDRFRSPREKSRLWYDGRDIPFLHEDAKDTAEITKSQVLAIEAGMRAGFKPDPMVQAVRHNNLDLLIGNHTGLFSVQMQPPGSADSNADGRPDSGGAAPAAPAEPIDFGALRADLWIYDEDEIDRAIWDAYGEDEEDDELDELERGHPYPGQRYRHGWIPVAVTGGGDERWNAPAAIQRRIREMEAHIEQLRREGPPRYERDPERYVQNELQSRANGLPIGARIPKAMEKRGFESLPSGHWRDPSTGRLYGELGPMGWTADLAEAERYLEEMKRPEYWKTIGEDATIAIDHLLQQARRLRRRRGRGVTRSYDLDDEDLERAFNPGQARIPAGHEGGGRFRGLYTQLVALLRDWAKGEGPADPIGEHFKTDPKLKVLTPEKRRERIRGVLADLRKQASESGDEERIARLTPRRGASEDELKAAIYKDVRAHVREGRDAKAEAPKRQAKFTGQGEKLHDVDVAVYRLPGDKPALYRENDAGKRGRLVKKFDSLDDMAAWADDNGEPRVAQWARKEGGLDAPAKPAAEPPQAPAFDASDRALLAMAGARNGYVETDIGHAVLPPGVRNSLVNAQPRLAVSQGGVYSGSRRTELTPAGRARVDELLAALPPSAGPAGRAHDEELATALAQMRERGFARDARDIESAETRNGRIAALRDAMDTLQRHPGGVPRDERERVANLWARETAWRQAEGDLTYTPAAVKAPDATPSGPALSMYSPTEAAKLNPDLDMTVPESRDVINAEARRRVETVLDDVDEMLSGDGSDRALLSRLDGRRKLGAPASVVDELEAAVREDEVENRIRAAYRDLQRHPGDWVPLAQLRERVGLDREEVDDALKRMAMQPGSHLIPWDNTKALSQADRDASVRFGGGPNHVLRLEDPSPRRDRVRQVSADIRGRLGAGTATKAPRTSTGPDVDAVATGIRNRRGESDIIGQLDRQNLTPGELDRVGQALGVDMSGTKATRDSKIMKIALEVARRPESGEPVASMPPPSRQPASVRIEALANAATAAAMGAPEGREAVIRDTLRDSKGPELRKVARELGVNLPPGLDEDGTREHIVKSLDSFAMTDSRGGIGTLPSAPSPAPAKKAPGRRVSYAQVQTGDTATWTDSDGVTNTGTVERLPRGVYVNWESGRRERVSSHGDHGGIVFETSTPAPGRAAAKAADPFSGSPAHKKRLRNMLATVDRGDYLGRGNADVEDLAALKSSGLIEEHAGSPHGWRLTDSGRAALNPPSTAPAKVAKPTVDEATFDPTTLDGLTIRQKRARLKAMGFSAAYIDEIAPTLAMQKKATAVRRSADPDPDISVDDEVDDEPVDEMDLALEHLGDEDEEEDDSDEALGVATDEVERAAGNRYTLRRYWTEDPEGLAKWVGHPHPWTSLRNHIRKYVGPGRAERIASQWFHRVFHIWPGERKGQNPVGPG